jgi:hypothetical protein
MRRFTATAFFLFLIVSAEAWSQDSLIEILPIVDENILDLVKTLPGTVVTDDKIKDADATTFAGVSAKGANIQRDGMMVNDVRWPAGINAATHISPYVAGEYRLISAPVDAEMGRGSPQVLITTKSGSNQYHGSFKWNIQSSALDPNTWEQNHSHNIENQISWRNAQQYSIAISGPIVKNKAFFFISLEGQRNRIRRDYYVRSLTPCARMGIFRYYDYWNNGSFSQLLDTSPVPRAAVADENGNPAPPPSLTGDSLSGPHNGLLRWASVYGQLNNIGWGAGQKQLDVNCSNYNPSTDLLAGTAWDVYRTQQDSSGRIADLLSQMPLPNNYAIGDGLNIAGAKVIQYFHGTDNLYGIGEDPYRRQITAKIDHNINNSNRVSGVWSWEKAWADNSFNPWINGSGTKLERRPRFFTIQLTSTLKPTLLNQFFIGMSRTGTNVSPAYSNPSLKDKRTGILPNINGVPMDPEAWLAGVDNEFETNKNNNITPAYAASDISPRYSLGDFLAWAKGAHYFKFGGEFRWASSEAENQGSTRFAQEFFRYASVEGGMQAAIPGINSPAIPGLAGSASSGNIRAMMGLLNFQAGSLAEIRQLRFINDTRTAAWNDPLNDPVMIRKIKQKEFSLFLKDDWKVTSNLTLNLGLRYEYYGVPYLANGLTPGLAGGSGRIFGLSGNSFADWNKPMTPTAIPEGSLTTLQYIGPGSAHPDQNLYSRDWNNWGPSIGFAYQLPWLGKGKTSLRGGYQINYIGNSGDFGAIQNAIGEAPNTVLFNRYTNNGKYFDLSALDELSSIPSHAIPGLEVVPVTDRLQNITAYAPNYATPFVHNFSVSVTRDLTSSMTWDLRYVGTRSRKLSHTRNINFPNYTTNGLLQAFNRARAGDNPELLDQLLSGQKLTPVMPVVDGEKYHGGQALRDCFAANYALQKGDPGYAVNLNEMLANGNYAGLANALNSWGAPAGQLLRQNNFPENFIKTNPQFNEANLIGNYGRANYHSLQTHLILRPGAGVSFNAAYVWSKNMGMAGGNYSDPGNLSADYSLVPGDRRHSFITYGIANLIFGYGKIFGFHPEGKTAKVLDGWQFSWFSMMQSGRPLNITASTGMYGVNVPDEVGNGFNFNQVGVTWAQGAAAGNYFHNRYKTVLDPQCIGVDAGIRGLCTLSAIKDSKSGQIVLQNPQPGTRGNFGFHRIAGPGLWNVDLALSKSIPLNDEKKFRLRIETSNVFNHPQVSGSLVTSGMQTVPTPPNTAMSGVFGSIPHKVGSRSVRLMMFFEF